MKQFKVTPAPFIKNNDSVSSLYEQKGVMLVMVLLLGVISFGWHSLWITLVSLASALVFELIYNFICYEKFKISDFTFIITALTYSCLAAPKTPLYVPVLAMLFSIVVCKMAFGGFANNVFEMAGAGALFVGCIFSGMSNAWLVIKGAGFAASPYASIASGELSNLNIMNFVSGQITSAIGCAFFIAIIVAYVYMSIFKAIDFKMPLIAILTMVICIMLFNGFDYNLILPYLLAGNFLFVSVFMLTDFTSNPNTTLGQVIFSIIFGLLAYIVTKFNIMGDLGIIAALIIANLFVPLFDRVIRPKYFGEGK